MTSKFVDFKTGDMHLCLKVNKRQWKCLVSCVGAMSEGSVWVSEKYIATEVCNPGQSGV